MDEKETEIVVAGGKVEASSTSPLVFISHDTRDAKLAEAFSKLLKSVSSNMIKSFRSSDKSGSDGIDYGDEWYKFLMEQLSVTSDVVCLFTETSLERPWILYEAGVAKSRIDTKVMGLALGIPLSKVGTGPFYHFQNLDDSEEALRKLLNQLAKRYKGLELDNDVVSDRIKAFKETVSFVLDEAGSSDNDDNLEENSIAKLAEEMKTLPSRVAERIVDYGDPLKRRRIRRLHPMMFEEMMLLSDNSGDPLGVLMMASMVRDDMPWLYELGMEAYRALRSGRVDEMQREVNRLRKFMNSKRFLMFMDEFGIRDEESHMMSREFPHMLEHALTRALSDKRDQSKKKLADELPLTEIDDSDL